MKNKRKNKGDVSFYLTSVILVAAMLVALASVWYLATCQLEQLQTQEPGNGQEGEQITVAYEKEVAAATSVSASF